jgi:hypothetical protein
MRPVRAAAGSVVARERASCAVEPSARGTALVYRTARVRATLPRRRVRCDEAPSSRFRSSVRACRPQRLSVRREPVMREGLEEWDSTVRTSRADRALGAAGPSRLASDALA